jgi:hypothetical protein
MAKKSGKRIKSVGEQGQAAVEAMFSVLIIVLLMLASCQILYTTMISCEAMKRAHKAAIALFREVNKTRGHDVYTTLEKVEGKVEVSANSSYARVIKGWSLFHKDYQPSFPPETKFGPGTMYRAVRGLMVAVGPLKGPGGKIESQPDGRSAFGVPNGGGREPKSDGDGYNNSGDSIRSDELYALCSKLGIEEECTYFDNL